MNNKQGVSFIIPVFNEAQKILKLIKYLEDLSAGFVGKIIILGGGRTSIYLKRF